MRALLLAALLASPSLLTLAASDDAPILGYVEARLPFGREGMAIAEVGGVIYVAGGWPHAPDWWSTPTDEILAYDPAADEVSIVGHLPAPLADATAASDGASVYIFGGRGPGPLDYQDRVLRFDPATGTVEILPAHLPTARAYARPVWTGEAFLLFGGKSDSLCWWCGGLLTDVLRYDPSAGSFTTLGAVLPGEVFDADVDPAGAIVYARGPDQPHLYRYDEDADALTDLGAGPYGGYRPNPILADGDGALLLGYGWRTQVQRLDANGARAMHADGPILYGASDAVRVGAAIYLLGDWRSDPTDRIVRYFPNADHVNGLPEARIAPLPSTIECTERHVDLDATSSSDPDGDGLRFVWNTPGWTPEGAQVSTWLRVGENTIHLRVDDGREFAYTQTNVRVVDTVPPQISIVGPMADTTYLSGEPAAHGGGPNGEALAYGQLTIEADAYDSCYLVSGVEFESSTGDSGADGWPPYEFTVPSPPAGEERVVTVRAIARDPGGNVAEASYTFLQRGLRIADVGETDEGLGDDAHDACDVALRAATCVDLFGEDPYETW